MKKPLFFSICLIIGAVVLLWFASIHGYFKKRESFSAGTAGVNCGPKALSGIIRYYRLEVPWDSLAKLSNTNINGTTMYDLASTAKLLGFETVGLKTGFPGLSKLPMPSLVFVNNNHFATLLWVGEDSVLIDDQGRRDFVKRQEFVKIWGGQVLALYPGIELQKKLNSNIP